MASLGLLIPSAVLLAGPVTGQATASPLTHSVAVVHAGAGASDCPGGAALGAAAGYAEFAFGNADRGLPQGDDGEGNLAYGGDATLENMYIGTYTGSPYALVVGHDLTVDGTLGLQSGAKGVYGGTSNFSTAGLSQGAAPFSFSALQSQITSDSSTWGAEATTAGDTVAVSGGVLTLTGSDDTLNVFALTPGEFASAQTIRIQVPVGSTTLVNVPDTNLSTTALNDVVYWNGSAWEAGDQYNSAAVDSLRNSTMFNFPAATTLDFSAAQLAATVIAPAADFTFNNGRADGTVIADQINGDFQSEYLPPFQGCQSPAQTIAGVIYECINGATTTTVVPGGTLATPGVLGGAAQANAQPATSVPAGNYTMTATAPSGWTLTACGTTDTSPEPVYVPVNGAGQGIFYVKQITQTIAGVIYECINGATTTTVVPGGTLTTPGVLGGAAQANAMAPTSVAAATYTMTATAPSGWTLTACGTTDASPESVVVPSGGAGEGIFYVTKVTSAKTGPGTTTTTTTAPTGTTPTTPATSGPVATTAGSTGGLAFTGAGSVKTMILMAVILLLLGAGLVLTVRRWRPALAAAIGLPTTLFGREAAAAKAKAWFGVDDTDTTN